MKYFSPMRSECQSPQSFKPEGASHIVPNAALCFAHCRKIALYCQYVIFVVPHPFYFIQSHGCYLAACIGLSFKQWRSL